jgi:hypothetical protein
VVDAAGVIRWHHFAPPEVNPRVDGILTALEALAQGKEQRSGAIGPISADGPQVSGALSLKACRTAHRYRRMYGDDL